jgi:hypothetical protein
MGVLQTQMSDETRVGAPRVANGTLGSGESDRLCAFVPPDAREDLAGGVSPENVDAENTLERETFLTRIPDPAASLACARRPTDLSSARPQLAQHSSTYSTHGPG